MKPRSLLMGVTATALLAGAGAAPAQTAESYDIALNPAKANRSTALTLAGKFDGQKVHDRVRFALPAGSKFNTRALRQCNATDQEIEAAGSPAAVCPAEAQIGEGQAVAIVGGSELTIPLRIWNRRNAMLILFQIGDTGFFAIAPIEGRTITIPLGQAPALDAKPTSFSLTIERRPAGEKPYLRAPRTCPSNRKWRSTLQYHVYQGGTTTLRDTIHCSKR